MKLAWSNLAARDLQSLQYHSVQQWGRTVARRYLSDIRAAARTLARYPDRAGALSDGFRLQRVRSHYLIVLADERADQLTVARVLHTSMDLERHLPAAVRTLPPQAS